MIKIKQEKLKELEEVKYIKVHAKLINQTFLNKLEKKRII